MNNLDYFQDSLFVNFNKTKLFIFLENGDLLLNNTGQTISNYGILQVYYSGSWGYVCHSGWSDFDSEVSCRQLGYNGYTSTRLNQIILSPTYYLSGGSCVGNEDKLINCGNDIQLGSNTSCSSSNNGVYVECEQSKLVNNCFTLCYKCIKLH